MDALKKAEQANQQGRPDAAPAAPGELALEEMASADNARAGKSQLSPDTPTALPKLPKLEDLDAEFLAHVQQPAPKAARAGERPAPPAGRAGPSTLSSTTSPPLAKSDDDMAREAVRNAFAAKQKPKTALSLGLVASAIGVLAAIVIGVYFWWQLRPLNGLAVRQPPVAAASASASAPAPAPAPQPAAATPATPPAAAPVDDDVRPAPPTRPGATPRPAMRPATPMQTPGSESIRFAKSRPSPAPAAGEAYAAFQAGDLDRARAAYQGLLQADPRNVDALHGLAAIALREGRADDAERIYLRILEADPRDAAANAGIVGLRSQGDPVASESRIKSLLAAQPGMPVLNFALGNLYARQNRWSEAQQAYFQACGGDAENPDYLFNLAISLDQLHQAKLAAQYYRQALTAAEHRPAAFDRIQVVNRLRDLAP